MSMRSFAPTRASLALLVAIAVVAVALVGNVVQRARLATAPLAPQVTAQPPAIPKILPDGTIVKNLPDGTIVKNLPDGTVHSTLPDGTVVSRKDGYSLSMKIELIGD
jgi:hypothetical protein